MVSCRFQAHVQERPRVPRGKTWEGGGCFPLGPGCWVGWLARPLIHSALFPTQVDRVAMGSSTHTISYLKLFLCG